MSKKLRASLIIVLAMLVLLSMVITAMPASVIVVDRTIIPENGGLVYVVDKFRGVDASFRFGIVEEMHNRLVQFNVDGGESKFVGKTSAGLYIYEITPKSTDLTITALYRELISDTGGNNYDLVINAEPIIQGQIVRANVIFSSTNYVKYPTAPPGWTPTQRGLEKNNITVSGDTPTDPIRIRLISSGLVLINIESLDMTYNPSESSIVISMKIKNLADSPLRQLELRFPDEIEVTEVRDTLGKLIYSWSSEKNILTINLEQSRYALQKSWRYSFTILAKCKTQEAMYISDDEAKMLVFTPINASINSLTISVLLPVGYEVNLEKADLVEYHYDAAGAALASINTKGLNVYQTDFVVLPVIKSSRTPTLASWLIGGGLVVIIVSAVVIHILRSQAPKVRIISEKDIQTISKALLELQKLRSTLLEIESALAPTAAKTKPQTMIDKTHAMRRIVDEIIDSLGKIEVKSPQLQEIPNEINSAASVISEALRVILRNYTDFQKGELSQQSYKKIYYSFRKDLRYAYEKLINIEDALRELSKK